MNKKPRNLDDLKPGMLTYEDAEPVRVRKPEIIMEPVPRRGVLGRIKDWILGPVMKPHAVMVLSKEERERLKELMKSDIVNSCAVTADDLKKGTDRLLTLARGHHIRNADGTVTDVSNNPRCKCKQKTEEKKLYGFGVNDTSLFGETFETVDELIEFAQTEYDNENSDYFDDEDQHCILVSAVKRVAPSDFAPSLDDIADQMTDRFYSEHNIDDDAEASYHPKEEAKKEWKAFVEKYFDIPYTLIGYADVGWYDLKEHRWVEKKED